jgi:hypothetical protein
MAVHVIMKWKLVNKVKSEDCVVVVVVVVVVATASAAIEM